MKYFVSPKPIHVQHQRQCKRNLILKNVFYNIFSVEALVLHTLVTTNMQCLQTKLFILVIKKTAKYVQSILE